MEKRNVHQMDIEDLEELRAAQLRDSLFHGLVSGAGLASLASGCGLGNFNADAIHLLWSIGLLRADYVSYEEPPELQGLQPVQASEDGAIYLDTRKLEHRTNGYGSAAANIASPHDGMSVFFHPFRLFVLYHVQRVFDAGISSTQFITWQPGIFTVASRLEESLVHFTSSATFGDRFNDWNVICEVAAIAEPMLHARFVPGVQLRAEEQRTAERLNPWFQALGPLKVREMRGELGRAAESMDSNTRVHVLMRLAQAQHRAKLKGRLGACMQFLNMAECIRRAAEIALEQQFPEEDQIGGGTWMQGARKMLYGTERVFDAGFGEVREYMTMLGLDHGIRVRCYVEGETELGAITRAVEGFDAIEVINLRGQFVQRNGKGLAFAASLKADFQAKVISIVVLDGDVGDNLRALRKTLRDGHCFAPYFTSKPDFERANFTSTELVQLFDEFQLERQPAGEAFVGSTSMATDTSQLRATALATAEALPKLPSFPKSASWGAFLMEHALAHPDMPTERLNHVRRPILEAAHLLLRACRAGFQYSVDNLTVDEATGGLVSKTSI
jgi:hypothetical protein